MTGLISSCAPTIAPRSGPGPRAMTVFIALCCSCVIAGCAAAPPPVMVTVAQPAGPNFFIAGHSVEGRPIECQILGDGPEVILIIASIHGDEPAGSPLVRRLSDYLQMNPHRLIGRRVVLMPVVNPDGMAHNTRANANGVDLNRNFPAGNRENSDRYGWSEFSEPETQILGQIIELYPPSRVIAIHQPLACVDYDGPAKDLAARLASLTRLPVKKLGTRPGSMGAFLGEMAGIPTITLELPGGVDKWNETKLWESYGDAMIASVVFPEAVQAELVGTESKPAIRPVSTSPLKPRPVGEGYAKEVEAK